MTVGCDQHRRHGQHRRVGEALEQDLELHRHALVGPSGRRPADALVAIATKLEPERAKPGQVDEARHAHA